MIKNKARNNYLCQQQQGDIIIILVKNNEIFHQLIALMLKSKSIKLLITNNQSHLLAQPHNQSYASNPSIFNLSSCSNAHSQPLCLTQQNSQLSHPLVPASPSMQYLQLTLSVSDASRHISTGNRNVNAQYGNLYQYDKSMFTIREQQSYEYESNIDSLYCTNKHNIMSVIEQLSSIKNKQKQNYNTSNHSVHADSFNKDQLARFRSKGTDGKEQEISSFECGDKAIDYNINSERSNNNNNPQLPGTKSQNVTMSSLKNTATNANYPNRVTNSTHTSQIQVQGWEQKYNSKNEQNKELSQNKNLQESQENQNYNKQVKQTQSRLYQEYQCQIYSDRVYEQVQEQQEQEQVQQEQIICLKQSEKSLNLQKDKIHNSCVILKTNEKVVKNLDIVYSCTDEQFAQIVKILQKQGIKILPKSNTKFQRRRILVHAYNQHIANLTNDNTHKQNQKQKCMMNQASKQDKNRKRKIKIYKAPEQQEGIFKENKESQARQATCLYNFR